MRTHTIAGRLVIPAAIVLFVGLGLLAYFFVSAEASKARILTEYEADHLASSLLDAYRAGDLDDPAKVDSRVLAFGIYRPSSAATVVYGSAPQTLDPAETREPFSFDPGKGTLTLVRSLGMQPPRMLMFRSRNGNGMMMMGPGPEAGGPPGPGRFGPGRSSVLYLTMDVSSFYRTQKVYSVSMIAAPLLVAGLAAAFFLLLASNTRYRRRAEERETMARLGESARTLAHEIRNPLGAIRIQTALLRKRLPADSLAEVAVIEEEAERLNAISRRVGELLKDP
ncbi:MAG TPA: histidine kinase dimerization/phospho-acceptor domain-containing protein, partial [Spirochaetia bacterium]